MVLMGIFLEGWVHVLDFYIALLFGVCFQVGCWEFLFSMRFIEVVGTNWHLNN